MTGVAVELRVKVGAGVPNLIAGEGVGVVIGETENSMDDDDVWVELVVGSAVVGGGLGWVAFHWMAKMINPMMPTAITSVHEFDFKAAPRFMQYLRVDYTHLISLGLKRNGQYF